MGERRVIGKHKKMRLLKVQDWKERTREEKILNPWALRPKQLLLLFSLIEFLNVFRINARLNYMLILHSGNSNLHLFLSTKIKRLNCLVRVINCKFPHVKYNPI